MLVCNSLSGLHKTNDTRVQIRQYLYSLLLCFIEFAQNNVQNVSKDNNLHATTKNLYINAATLQKVQHTTVSAVDQLAVVQNSYKK